MIRADTSLTEQEWYADFEYAAGAETKLKRLLEYGADLVTLVPDWDGVLATKAPDGLDGTTWALMRRYMPEKNQRAHLELYKYYGQKEKAGTLTLEESDRWQTEAMRLLIGASVEAIEEDAAKHMTLRPGVEELFGLCEARGIPVIIKSTGITQIIDAVATKHGLHPTSIYSNKLLTENGRVIGFDETTLHSLNKSGFSHWDLPECVGRPHALLLGDNLHDRKMVTPAPQASHNHLKPMIVSARIDGGRDSHPDEASWKLYLQTSFQGGYDMAAVHADVFGVNEILRSMA